MNSKSRMALQMRDVVLGAGEEIVDAEDLVALLQQPVDQVRAEETGAAGDHHAFARIIIAGQVSSSSRTKQPS